MSGAPRLGNCEVCGKQRARKLCDRCHEVRCCGRKHLKRHQREKCLPSTRGLSDSEKVRIEGFVRDMVDATTTGDVRGADRSSRKFVRILEELQSEMTEQIPEKDLSKEYAWQAKLHEGSKVVRSSEKKVSFFVGANGMYPLVRGLDLYYFDMPLVLIHHLIPFLEVVTTLNEEVLFGAIEAGVVGVVARFFSTDTRRFETKKDFFGFQAFALHLISIWLGKLPGSGALRREMVERGLLRGVVQWLLSTPDKSEKVSLLQFLAWESTKYQECQFLYSYASHNLGHKTAIVQSGGLRAIGKAFEEYGLKGGEELKVALRQLIEVLSCRCQRCMESKYCNTCDQKAAFACSCNRVRYCSTKCQEKDIKNHKRLCKSVRHNSTRSADYIDHVKEECDRVKGVVNFAEDSFVDGMGTDKILKKLRHCTKPDDATKLLLLFARCPAAEIVALSGFLDLFKVMDRFEEVTSIQTRACAACCVLSAGFQSEVVQSILESGGVETILDAMEKHSGDVKFAGCATTALVTLAAGRTEEGRCPDDILHAIIHTMKQHTDDYGVQCAGCGALWNLCPGKTENKVTVLEAGGISAVMAAWEKFWDQSSDLDERAINFWKFMLE